MVSAIVQQTPPDDHAPVKKRAEVAGLIANLECRIAQYRADLIHLDATIAVFDPGVIIDDIKPKYPESLRLALLANGELTPHVACWPIVTSTIKPTWQTYGSKKTKPRSLDHTVRSRPFSDPNGNLRSRTRLEDV